MNAHYDYLNTRTFTIFKLNNISKTNKKVLLEDINNNNNKEKEIGIIYVFNEINEIKEEQNDNYPTQQFASKEENQIIKKGSEKKLMLNQQIINQIKFLTGFYLFYKDIKSQTIQPNSSYKEYEKGYMINEKLFKIYSKLYYYNKLKDILNNDYKIKLAIEKYKNLYNDVNIEEISNEISLYLFIKNIYYYN